jgi:hypothetical protein
MVQEWDNPLTASHIIVTIPCNGWIFLFPGKFILILVVIGLVLGGGYYLGKGKLPFAQYQAPGAVTTIEVVTQIPTPTLTNEMPLTTSPSPAVAQQTVTGGGQSVYPGEAAGEMSSSFAPFVTIHDASGNEYRRAVATGTSSGSTVGQKIGTTFGLPTMYGHVTYGTPASLDPAMLEELDAIFATLKKS